MATRIPEQPQTEAQIKAERNALRISLAVEEDKRKGAGRRAWRRIGDEVDKIIGEYRLKNNAHQSAETEAALFALERVKKILADAHKAKKIDGLSE